MNDNDYAFVCLIGSIGFLLSDLAVTIAGIWFRLRNRYTHGRRR